MPVDGSPVAGILLAAGGGSRMGTPKALLRDVHDVPQVDRAVGALLDGGCATVVVVLGAEAEAARHLLDEVGWLDDPCVRVAECQAWADGMSASLRCGLDAVAEDDVDAAVVLLVDLPDVDSRVVRRVVAEAGPGTLARAAYAGRPGHPVVIGRDHWAGVQQTLTGDRGARDYLDAHSLRDVACDDLASGADADTPEDLQGLRRPH
jgi:molybdenum cofactor cytidylyltransferase/nicotine blue oxidoreductase